MEYYNFYQQCEDHFATARATDQNHVTFAYIFLINKTLYHSQKHKQKIEDSTTISIM